LLEVWEERCDHNDLQYYLDIRSWTLYLSGTVTTFPNVACECDAYVIHNPIIQNLSCLELLAYWTEIHIKELYKTMARTGEYRSFIIVTHDDVTADVKNQLVLL
jgi:hypothetical protein